VWANQLKQISGRRNSVVKLWAKVLIFIFALFDDTFSPSEYLSSHTPSFSRVSSPHYNLPLPMLYSARMIMNDESERMWKEGIVSHLRQYCYHLLGSNTNENHE
jgi:hypothetical protein